MKTFRVVLLFIGLLAVSETGADPTPNALFQFQKDNRGHPWLRILGDSGTVERKVTRIDPLGLHGLSTPDGVQLPGPMAWSRIRRIDEVVTRATPWRTAGAVALGALGAGLGNALGAPKQQGGRMALVGLLTFGGVGAWLGGEYGARFRSERNWYVADTTRTTEPAGHIEVLASASAGPSADAAVLDVCNRIGRNELFRAYGSFGSFQGYAGIAGPEGLEALRVGGHGQQRGADTTLPRSISWEQVDRIEMREGSALKGAMIGGAGFAALGAVLGMAAVGVAQDPNVTVAEGGALGALYVAPVGVLIGGLTGMAARHWVAVYRRP